MKGGKNSLGFQPFSTPKKGNAISAFCGTMSRQKGEAPFKRPRRALLLKSEADEQLRD